MSARADAATFWLYILELANGHLYTGYARDLVRRYSQHCSGKGARTTRISVPRRIAACWRLRCTIGDALRLEAMVKRGGRPLKQRLIADPARLRQVVRRCALAVRVSLADPKQVGEDRGAKPVTPQPRTTRSRPSRLAR